MKKVKITRDGSILTFAFLWGSWEIGFGGARPSVLTLVTAMILSPVALRLDDARKASLRRGEEKVDANDP